MSSSVSVGRAFLPPAESGSHIDVADEPPRALAPFEEFCPSFSEEMTRLRVVKRVILRFIPCPLAVTKGRPHAPRALVAHAAPRSPAARHPAGGTGVILVLPAVAGLGWYVVPGGEFRLGRAAGSALGLLATYVFLDIL